MSDAHVKGCGTLGDGAADAAVTENAQALARHAGGEGQRGLKPLAGAHMAIAQGDLAADIHHHADGQVGDAVIEHIGRVADGNFAPLGGIDVHRVVADVKAGDDLELGQRVDQLGEGTVVTGGSDATYIGGDFCHQRVLVRCKPQFVRGELGVEPVERVLVHGSDDDDFRLNNAQAFTLGTTVPASAIMDLASARDIKIVGIPDDKFQAMRKLNPGYTKLIIPAGSYPKQTADVPTIGYATHVIARCDLDETVVYKVLKGMVENKADLAAIAKAMAGVTPKMMAEDIGVPMHKGAMKYYKEVGAL
jgi:hypothetical protein